MPWFMTVFGRDTEITSLQTLLLGPELATGSLEALAELQAEAEDPAIDAEPGKIVHEVRAGRAAEKWFARYYGSIDATPLFLVLLAETWRWTDDAALVTRLREPALRALEWIDRNVRALEPEEVSLDELHGRVLAADLVAGVDVPAFDRAAMDGYALRGAETIGASEYNPLAFELRGAALPGRPYDGEVMPNTAIRIMTGAPMPAGADAVVPAEFALEREGRVEIAAPIATGRNVGRRAEDVRAHGRRYARDILPGVVRPHALERITWHKGQGDTVVVVSASLDAYVVPWCASLGVDAICTALDERDGVLTGRYAGGECSAPAKVQRIRERGFHSERLGLVDGGAA